MKSLQHRRQEGRGHRHENSVADRGGELVVHRHIMSAHRDRMLPAAVTGGQPELLMRRADLAGGRFVGEKRKDYADSPQ